MEVLKQKNLEKLVSQKAMQMGSSFQCKICVIGFLCGICLASLLVAALTSLATFHFADFSASDIIGTECNINAETKSNDDHDLEAESSLLYSAWTETLTSSSSSEILRINVPAGPHLENCRLKSQRNERLDRRMIGKSSLFPPWSGWKGDLDMFPGPSSDEGSYPPWVVGSDEENYPLTRKVQRDLWLHQHALNCSDSRTRFLVADWETEPGFGIGAQIAGMAGLFAIAVNEKRVLVTGYYNRADHSACTGSSRSSWSCYFFPETSRECRDRAFELVASKEAWKKGAVTGKQSYNSKQIWSGPTPRLWGKPWSFLQPTTEINGTLIARHRKMDRRWWRAQAVRYLMRYQSEHTCGLLNSVRHASFGKEAARMVVRSFSGGEERPTVQGNERTTKNMEEYVWSSHEAWLPRPFLSVHVRMGDKACEMKIVEFEEYMRIAARIRRRFPHLNSIWLSTEMQEVIDKSKRYQEWRFYHTDVKRQSGNGTMAEYEAGLGRERATENSMVNLLMAAEADFFVGALGSTWCFLIDGMRNTGGKVMAGYLSVNKDRFW